MGERRDSLAGAPSLDSNLVEPQTDDPRSASVRFTRVADAHHQKGGGHSAAPCLPRIRVRDEGVKVKSQDGFALLPVDIDVTIRWTLFASLGKLLASLVIAILILTGSMSLAMAASFGAALTCRTIWNAISTRDSHPINEP